MQESKAHMQNANFSIKNSDGLTVALNINATYNNNRKNYIIIHPPIIIIILLLLLLLLLRRSQWPCGLGRRSLAARLLRLWVRIPPGAWIFVCCECCVLSGRGLCDGLIIRSEESYRMWRVVVCDQETSQARRLKPTRGL